MWSLPDTHQRKYYAELWRHTFTLRGSSNKINSGILDHLQSVQRLTSDTSKHALYCTRVQVLVWTIRTGRTWSVDGHPWWADSQAECQGHSPRVWEIYVSGVTRLGVTRAGNWRCHRYFFLIKNWRPFLVIAVCKVMTFFSCRLPHNSHIPTSFVQCSF